MRPVNPDIVGEIEDRIDPLTACVVDFTARAELVGSVGADGVCDQEIGGIVHEADDSSEPIEFITENGFSIIRPWESGNAPMPADGRCRFGVSDGFIEREVTVEICPRVVTEISLRTRGRIELSNSFWIGCAERHLANYVSENADFPEDDKLILEELDREDILWALRWENGSDE